MWCTAQGHRRARSRRGESILMDLRVNMQSPSILSMCFNNVLRKPNFTWIWKVEQRTLRRGFPSMPHVSWRISTIPISQCHWVAFLGSRMKRENISSMLRYLAAKRICRGLALRTISVTSCTGSSWNQRSTIESLSKRLVRCCRFLNLLRASLRVGQVAHKIVTCGTWLTIFGVATGQKCRYEQMPSWTSIEANGSKCREELRGMFAFTQINNGKVFGEEPNDISVAAALKKAARQVQGNADVSLFTLKDWIRREWHRKSTL